ncbi:MAG: hypothetical protein M3Y80_00355 [Verrucomicrobiota bacterium]|nr:hypothetical protein [Verrucomicrobiota bacterium]
MQREDDQELWDLLGQTTPPTLSPFFARNVVRQIRQEPSWREKVAGWFAPRRLMPAGAVAAAVLAAAISLHHPPRMSQPAETVQDALAQLDPIDYLVVADLDDLLATEDDNLWNDGDTSTL